METEFYRLVLATLAVWRVTHLLNAEDGPWDLVVRIRRRAGTGFWAGLLDCFNCLSLWVAAPAALLLSRKPIEWLLSWLATSGAACLLERMAKEPIAIQPVAPMEEGEINDVLRPETLAVTEKPVGEEGAQHLPKRAR